MIERVSSLALIEEDIGGEEVSQRRPQDIVIMSLRARLFIIIVY